jgi:hypothetical protein
MERYKVSQGKLETTQKILNIMLRLNEEGDGIERKKFEQSYKCFNTEKQSNTEDLMKQQVHCLRKKI